MNKWRTLSFICVLVVLITMTTGCPPSYRWHEDTLDNDLIAKQFAVRPDSEQVYIYRKKKVEGSLGPMIIQVDREDVGFLQRGNFILLSLSPGEHEVGVWSTLIYISGFKRIDGSPIAKVRIEAMPGGMVFMECENYFSDPPTLKIVNADAGQMEIKKRRLVMESRIPYRPK